MNVLDTVWAYHAVIIFLVLIMFVLTTNGGIGSKLSYSLSLNCLCIYVPSAECDREY